MKEGEQERKTKGTKTVDVQRKTPHKLSKRFFFHLEGRRADGGIKMKEEEERERGQEIKCVYLSMRSCLHVAYKVCVCLNVCVCVCVSQGGSLLEAIVAPQITSCLHLRYLQAKKNDNDDGGNTL